MAIGTSTVLGKLLGVDKRYNMIPRSAQMMYALRESVVTVVVNVPGFYCIFAVCPEVCKLCFPSNGSPNLGLCVPGSVW